MSASNPLQPPHTGVRVDNDPEPVVQQPVICDREIATHQTTESGGWPTCAALGAQARVVEKRQKTAAERKKCNPVNIADNQNFYEQFQ